jgi:predicted MPP superfamily phosphohydrolase
MPKPTRVTRRGALSGALAALTLPSVAAAEYKRIATEQFEVTRTEVWLPSLDPAHDGLKVAQLSDIHVGFGTPDGRIISAIRALNEQKPDLVALTGDYVTTQRDPYDRVPDLLRAIAFPTFAVLGNHDHWTDAPYHRKSLERIGHTVLQNRHTVTRLRGVDFTVVGIDDGRTERDDVDASFKGIAETGSRLVLTHLPTTARKLPAWQGLLCLSGHTHGGQIHIPGVTSALFARAGYPYLRGEYSVRGNHLYVNRGLGFGKGGGLPRLGTDPELSIFVLRSGVAPKAA